MARSRASELMIVIVQAALIVLGAWLLSIRLKPRPPGSDVVSFKHWPAFTPEQAALIRPGATLEDVEEVLGMPAGNYAGPKTGWIGSGPKMWWLHPEGWKNPHETELTVRAWISDSGMIVVDFNTY